MSPMLEKAFHRPVLPDVPVRYVVKVSKHLNESRNETETFPFKKQLQ